MCRRERDAQLFSAIKQWETEKYQQSKDKTAYKRDLSMQKEKLEADVKAMPHSIANKHRRWRYQSDIEQL